MRDVEDLGAGYTHQEGDGIEDVAEDELKSEMVDAESKTDPGEETVDEVYESQDGQNVGPFTEVS